MGRSFTFFAVAIALATAPWTAAVGAERPEPVNRKHLEQTVAKGIAFLRTKGQAEDGSFSKANGPGITALVVRALLVNGAPATDPSVERGLKYLEQFIQPDGGVYRKGSLYRNYETCLAILAFTAANGDHRYDKQLKRADAFIKGLQWTAEEGADESDFAHGGAGYGKHGRPDLSNTSFLVEALKANGNSADSDAIQRALLFISRCQNLESEHNKTPFSTKNPDGGFYYTPAAGGTSQAGKTANGGLRSYGSMTYVGLKSMIFAGVGPDDKRVKAAFKWIQKHYSLEQNPGMGASGLFYYYHTFAKALAAMDQTTLTDEDGVEHDWRAELVAELKQRQRDDGSFVNANDRWLESDPNLVTAYALLALSYCKPAKEGE